MSETFEQRANRLLNPQVAERPVITPTYVWDQKASDAFTNRPPVVTTPQSVVPTTTTSAWLRHCQAEAERYGGFPPVSPYTRPQQDENGWPPTTEEVVRFLLIVGAAFGALLLLIHMFPHPFC